jgi:hypothetical protein
MNSFNEDIIPKLKFISKLNKGDKINVKNMYIQPNNLLNRIIRTFYMVDDRSNTLLFVNNTVKKGFDLFLSHVDSKNPFDLMLCKNIVNDLKNAKNGLFNLKETYIEDVMFICKIDALIQEIDAKLIEIQSTYHFIDIKEEKEANEEIIKEIKDLKDAKEDKDKDLKDLKEDVLKKDKKHNK